jgi:hypothetical protein
MTSTELHDLLTNIISGLEVGADMASTIAPGLIPFIIIGKAVDKILPDLASQVQRWVEGNPPTQQELDEFKAKLAVLSDPDAP